LLHAGEVNLGQSGLERGLDLLVRRRVVRNPVHLRQPLPGEGQRSGRGADLEAHRAGQIVNRIQIGALVALPIRHGGGGSRGSGEGSGGKDRRDWLGWQNASVCDEWSAVLADQTARAKGR